MIIMIIIIIMINITSLIITVCGNFTLNVMIVVNKTLCLVMIITWIDPNIDILFK